MSKVFIGKVLMGKVFMDKVHMDKGRVPSRLEPEVSRLETLGFKALNPKP